MSEQASDRPRTVTTGATLVIDVRNVVGSRPDGWWHDPEGASRDLIEEVAASSLPADWHVVAVVDGPPSDRLPEAPLGPVEVLRAGRGRDAADDRIVELLRDHEVPRDASVTVVTADRELRDRVAAVRDDVALVGPTWLRDRLGGEHRSGPASGHGS